MHRHRRAYSISTLIATTWLTTGCVPANLELLPSNIVIPGIDTKVQQLWAGAKGQSRLLVIHGMGSDRCPGYSGYRDRYKGKDRRKDGMVTKIAYAMNLCLINDPIPDSGYANCREDMPKGYPSDIVLTTFDYGRLEGKHCDSSRTIMRTYEIYYTGVMEAREIEVEERDRRVLKLPAFVNRRLKTNVVITGLGDAVAYLGQEHGNAMRSATAKSICRMMSDSAKSVSGQSIDIQSADCPTAAQEFQPMNTVSDTYILSHSLGSNIVLDTLGALYDWEKESMALSDRSLEVATDAAEKLRDRLRGVYLLANQHALLGLAGDSKQLMRGLTTTGDTVITAFSGRTDLLSHALAEDDCPSGPTRCVNAVLNVARFRIPFFYSNPLKAHTGYESDPVVIDCIAHGCSSK